MTKGMGVKLRGGAREAGIAHARQWHLDNKPFFDAIYGPDTRRQSRPRCASCGGTGLAAETTHD